MQLSMVLSQRTWPGVGDFDECWIMSILQCTLAVAPWEYLPGTDAMRAAAGDPDDGDHDGGNIREIRRAVRELWPRLDPMLTSLDGISIDRLKAEVRAGRPVSIALMPGKLPPRLRHGVGNVPHQCTVAERASGTIAFANPFATTGDRWDDVQWSDIVPAIEAYGRGKAVGVAWPSEHDALTASPTYRSRVAADVKAGIEAAQGPALEVARKEGRTSMRSEAIAAANALVP